MCFIIIPLYIHIFIKVLNTYMFNLYVNHCKQRSERNSKERFSGNRIKTNNTISIKTKLYFAKIIFFKKYNICKNHKKKIKNSYYLQNGKLKKYIKV